MLIFQTISETESPANCNLTKFSAFLAKIFACGGTIKREIKNRKEADYL